VVGNLWCGRSLEPLHCVRPRHQKIVGMADRLRIPRRSGVGRSDKIDQSDLSELVRFAARATCSPVE
jgi:hypothetical protein